MRASCALFCLEIWQHMRLYKLIIVSFLLLLGATRLRASHIYGGELLYTHISGNTYRVALTLYGDCSAAIFYTLDTISTIPNVNVYNDGVFFETLKLKLEAHGVEVSPVCPGMLSSTSCNGGTLPGVKRFIYSDTVNLGTPPANWKFVFAGLLEGAGTAGRSSQITNILGAGSSVTYLEATLDNTHGPNNSPQYTTIPTPYYCTNINQQYNQGAIDQDGDSLAFSLVPALNGNTTNPLLSPEVSYLAPFTAEAPLSTDAGQFSFSDVNGQMTFTPNFLQSSLIVNRVTEYRNGQIVGTSEREMTFIVTDCNSGNPPTLHVSDLNSGATYGNIINICVGTPTLSFNIDVNNPTHDTTDITPKSVPGNAILTVHNNNTPYPSITFSWVTDTLKVGIYTFFLDVKNYHCPIASRQTLAYTINVASFPQVSVTQLSPTECLHQALMQYTLTQGFTPRYLTVYSGGTQVYSATDSSGTVIDSLPAGSYSVTVASDPLCTTSTSFTINDGGTLPLASDTAIYCQRDVALQLQTTPYGPDATIKWYDASSNLLPQAPTPSTANAGTYIWYVQQDYKTCTSAQTPMEVIVHPLPDIQITSVPSEVCFGDTIILAATGGISYTWSPDDFIDTTATGTLFSRITRPTSFNLKVTNEFACTDSTVKAITTVNSCCVFSYPTAFTPNNDGLNDGFKVIIPGHTWDYKLAIYNRWGQLVFLSFDPKQYWDGKQNGVPCEMGTYYYYFEGRCLTGASERHQGDVTLIR